MTARRPLPTGPGIVGIVNVTPDSFSDGGQFTEPQAAIDHGLRLLEEGAVALDIGAESTRPGASPVAVTDELARLLPVLAGLRSRTDAPLSVDTRRIEVAVAALAEGADILNDVSMLRNDIRLAREAARAGATLIVMHSRGEPATMQELARYDDVTGEVASELRDALDRARDAGCERLVADPGFGFAKTSTQNLELLQRLPELAERLGTPLLVGLSRKALAGHLLSRDGVARPVDNRAAGSVGLALAALSLGADWVRVHDVAMTADALATFRAATGAPP